MTPEDRDTFLSGLSPPAKTTIFIKFLPNRNARFHFRICGTSPESYRLPQKGYRLHVINYFTTQRKKPQVSHSLLAPVFSGSICKNILLHIQVFPCCKKFLLYFCPLFPVEGTVSPVFSISFTSVPKLAQRLRSKRATAKKRNRTTHEQLYREIEGMQDRLAA